QLTRGHAVEAHAIAGSLDCAAEIRDVLEREHARLPGGAGHLEAQRGRGQLFEVESHGHVQSGPRRAHCQFIDEGSSFAEHGYAPGCWGEIPERSGLDAWLEMNTVERRTHSLSRQDWIG